MLTTENIKMIEESLTKLHQSPWSYYVNKKYYTLENMIKLANEKSIDDVYKSIESADKQAYHMEEYECDSL